MKKKVCSTIALMLFSIIAFTQTSDGPTEMADLMRSNGKIYVVTAIILTIFAGIILYLIRIDRKMNRLEKEEF